MPLHTVNTPTPCTDLHGISTPELQPWLTSVCSALCKLKQHSFKSDLSIPPSLPLSLSYTVLLSLSLYTLVLLSLMFQCSRSLLICLHVLFVSLFNLTTLPLPVTLRDPRSNLFTNRCHPPALSSLPKDSVHVCACLCIQGKLEGCSF